MITQNELKQLVHYSPETGRFCRLVSSGGRKAGVAAGSAPNRHGYTMINVNGKRHSAHRLAYFYMTGQWAPHDIDHIDGNRSNNAFSNLRLATRGENQQNMVKPRSSNKSGLLGVSRHGSGWRAKIGANGHQHSLGSYPTPQQAHAAYLKAKADLHIEVTRDN